MGRSAVRGLSVLVAGVALLLTGCDVATTGAAGPAVADQQRADNRRTQRDAVAAALEEFSAQQAVVYRSQSKNDAGEISDLALNVTKSGTAFGAVGVRGQVVNLVEADGKPYLSAPAAYWKTQGVDEAQAEEYGKRWMYVEAGDLPVQPSQALVPSAVAATLRDAAATVDQFADPMIKKQADGVEVYEIATEGGKLVVTALKPYRVVSFETGVLGESAGKAFGEGVSIQASPLAGDGLGQFKNGLNGAVDGFAQAFDYAAELQVSVENNQLDCSQSGSCTSNISVRNTLTGADGRVASVRVLVKAEVSAPGLGSQTCTAEGSSAPNATVSVPCTVRFSVPNRTASYSVLSTPSASGEAVAAVDVGGIKQKIETEFAGLGG